MVDTANDLRLVDKCAFNSTNEYEMPRSVDLFDSVYSNYGLTISTKKTEVLHQPDPGAFLCGTIHLSASSNLAAPERFVYLGSALYKSADIDVEITYRIARASAVYGGIRVNACCLGKASA